jgi:uncharacterized protein (DUF1778 family)
MAKKIGRPKKQIKYTKVIHLRVTTEQWLKILNAAQREHLDVSSFLRKIALDRIDNQ